VRRHHQRPRDGDSLLLASGELVRVLPSFLRESDDVEQLLGAFLGVATRDVPDPADRERQVVHHLQVREEVELLEDDPDLLADLRDIHALPGDLLALEENPAFLDRLEQVDAAQERALAAPARPDHDEHFAALHAEVDPIEDEVVAEALAHALEPHDRRPGGLGHGNGRARLRLSPRVTHCSITGDARSEVKPKGRASPAPTRLVGATLVAP
jgi:hypothetical protein